MDFVVKWCEWFSPTGDGFCFGLHMYCTYKHQFSHHLKFDSLNSHFPTVRIHFRTFSL